MSGWLKLHRKLLESPVWQNSSAAHKAIVVTILMQADHDPKPWWDEERGKEIVRDPGSFVTSYRTLAEDAEVSLGAVRNALKRLEAQDFIQVSTHRKYTIITVCNWTCYQSEPDNNTANNTRDDTQGERKVNAGRTQGDTQGERKQDVKTLRSKEGEKGTGSPPSGSSENRVEPIQEDPMGYMPEDAEETGIVEEAVECYREAWNKPGYTPRYSTKNQIMERHREYKDRSAEQHGENPVPFVIRKARRLYEAGDAFYGKACALSAQTKPDMFESIYEAEEPQEQPTDSGIPFNREDFC